MRDLISRVSWPQVAALACVVFGTVAFFVFVPPHTLDKIAAWDWKAIVAGTLALAGALGGTVGGPLVRKREPSALPSLPPMSIPPLSMPPLPPLPETPTTIDSPRARRRSETPPADSMRPATRRGSEE
jgi:hypothetical protein